MGALKDVFNNFEGMFHSGEVAIVACGDDIVIMHENGEETPFDDIFSPPRSTDPHSDSAQDRRHMIYDLEM